MDIANFKLLYKVFESVDDSVIEALIEKAKVYVCDNSKCYDQLLQLVVAHLLHLSENSSGATSSISSTSIDKVSVGFNQSIINNSTEQFFNLSPYGVEFLALRNRCKPRFKYFRAK